MPLLGEIKAWADITLPQVAPSSLIGKALAYLTKHWTSLIGYCEDGRLDIDNNAVERAIRPFVTGRNNWIFSDTVNGAKASGNLCSLIETTKLNGLESNRYLWHIFVELTKAQTLADIERLLPWVADPGVRPEVLAVHVMVSNVHFMLEYVRPAFARAQFGQNVVWTKVWNVHSSLLDVYPTLAHTPTGTEYGHHSFSENR